MLSRRLLMTVGLLAILILWNKPGSFGLNKPVAASTTRGIDPNRALVSESMSTSRPMPIEVADKTGAGLHFGQTRIRFQQRLRSQDAPLPVSASAFESSCQFLNEVQAGELEPLRTDLRQWFTSHNIDSKCNDSEACHIAAVLMKSTTQQEFDKFLGWGGILSRLYRSLNRACWIEGVSCQEPDLKATLRELAELQKQDPENGIYAYYNAQALIQLGALRRQEHSF